MTTPQEKTAQAYAAFEAKLTDYNEGEKKQVRKAFDIANEYLIGKFRENGDPFIFHAINVAAIVISEMGLSIPSAIAIFLHEALRTATENTKHTTQQFGKEIQGIVEGLTKISNIDIKATSLQAENFRKLIVSLSNDPRVTIIKLADRLEVSRSLSFFSPLKQQKKSTETLLLYAPIAHQLGLYNLKSELEDISLRYSEPEAYRLISNKLKSTADDRSKLIKDFLKPIELELKKQGLRYEVKSRTKSIYSIWTKMQKQKVDFEGVFDVFAIRIILDTPPEQEHADCWKVYSIITHLYTPHTERLRDWLTVPKASGYESLHITVDSPEGRTVEVQIRTQRMDEVAEKGAAAHWKYKGVQQSQGVQQWLDKVRELLESPTQVRKDSFLNFTPNEIFVFTPNGDLRRLPAGATVLDFAFDIHSGIGSRCIGARVNGKSVTIKEALKTGDTIEITTAKNQTPKSDWLSYVVTSKARARIKAALREEQLKVANMGKELLERRLKNWKVASLDDSLALLMKYYKVKTITELYSQLANEKINLLDVKEILTKGTDSEQHIDDKQAEPAIVPAKKSKAKQVNDDYLVIDDSLQNLSYKLAKCCNPIKGDDVFGFVTINDGIKIHRFTCPNASRLLENYDYRIVKARWKETQEGTFQASLKIVGYEELGLVSSITEVLSAMSLSIRSLNVSNIKGNTEVRLHVMVPNTKQLDILVYRLQALKGIAKVIRTS